jgi:hypothetical protein
MKNETGGVFGLYGGAEKFVEGVGDEIWENETTTSTQM